MRFGHILLFLTSFTLVFAAVPATKAPVRKGAVRSPARGKATAKKGTKAAPPTAFRSRQQQPTQDRYREIQQALAEKGYLKSEPSGVWGAESVDALKQFQTTQKIPVTGKLSSRSLIGLGLGPKNETAPAPQ